MVEIGLVVGGEMEGNLNKRLRKGKKVEAIPSKIHLKAQPPQGPAIRGHHCEASGAITMQQPQSVP